MKDNLLQAVRTAVIAFNARIKPERAASKPCPVKTRDKTVVKSKSPTLP